MDKLRNIRFPKCVMALEGQFKKPLLMVLGDSSREVWCSLVYLQWKRDHCQILCHLVMPEAQVAPKVKITNPSIELLAAVNFVRLARKVKESLRIPLAGTRYFTDSSAVLEMLRTKSGRFTEFVVARVSEVKVNSNIEEEWLWLVENCNPADLGTRSTAVLRT
jgi:hypothetical protein